MRHVFIKGGTIVSMDPRIGSLVGEVLIEGEKILALGAGVPPPPDAEIVDASGMIVMPGFVNAHIHTWQTGLRGVAGDWTIQQYLRAMHSGLATLFRPDDIHIANLAGALNQIDCGTTTIVDWCHNNPTPEHTDAAIDGLEESGIRALFLHGSAKPEPREGEPHFSQIGLPRGEIRRLKEGRMASADRRVTLGLAVLGPGMSTYDVARQDLALAREFDLVASMHVTGRMLVADGFERLCQEPGLIGPSINLVHANRLTPACLSMLVERGVSFTVTPEVEMQMGFGRPLTNRLRVLRSPVSLGSDVESAMAADMFAVTRFALQAARFMDGLATIDETGSGPDDVSVSCQEALGWATIDGAKAGGLAESTGSLAPGKQADIVLLKPGALDLSPFHLPAASVVLQAGPKNVDSVLIGGVFQKRNGQLLFPDLPGCAERLRRSGSRIVSEFRAGYPSSKV